MTEKAYIGLHMSPIVKHAKKELPHEEKDYKMYQLTISCGGGMGGAKWTENVYIKPSDYKKVLFEGFPFFKVKDVVTDEERLINARNIVEIRDIHAYLVEFEHDNNNFELKHRKEYYFRPTYTQFIFASHVPAGYKLEEVDKTISY